MIFVGNDWAEGHHDVYLMDPSPPGVLPSSDWRVWPACMRWSEPSDAADRNHGSVLWSDQVYAINPMAVSRYRDRHSQGGAKSDRGDAKVLADLVRTDRHNHRPVAGDSPESEGIKIMARAHQNLIWARVRHTNQMRNALREYYPAAIETFDDLAHRDTLAVLGRAATPTRGARLTLPQIRAALQRAGRKRNLDKVARRIQKGLRGAHLTAPGPVADAFGTIHKIIAETNHQIEQLSRPVLKNTRTVPARTRYRARRPGAVRGLHQRQVSQEQSRPSPWHQAANTPSWPARSATGDSTTPSTNGRSVP